MQAHAKVNLCLYLGPTRASDGRHELVTVFQSLSLADGVSVESAEVDEVICPGVYGPNLAADALGALRRVGWDAPPVRVLIDKRIPIAAGMAGGSADAAAVLRLAAEDLPPKLLGDLARLLGADVPFQLRPGIGLGLGAGEVVVRTRPVAAHAYVVVPLPFGLSTAAVYREADRLGLARDRDELAALQDRVLASLGGGDRFPAELIVNDLQAAALSLEPSIAEALAAVSAVGAEHALVSGSGPTVVGIWWGAEASEQARAAASSLSGSFPGTLTALPYALSSQLGGSS